uniref:Integrase catalytic domain-containing protein n=1 Tax=Cacopsylla melanoneura TaxID=428564 RepID=A0A8D8WIH7_9HEMI
MPPSDVNAKLQVCVKKRDQYFERVNRAFTLIKSPGKEEDFKIRAEFLQSDDTIHKFESILESINILNEELDKKDRVDCSQTMSSFEELYFKVLIHEATLKATNPTPTPPPAAPARSSDENKRIKLPQINIPVFTGDVSAFPSFKSLYDQIIHNNPDLSDVQKFSYLKGHLGPQASGCIEHITFVEANYPLAYATVATRYGKRRVLANTYLSKIMKFSQLQSDNVKGLRAFLDTFHINVESLKGLMILDLGEFILLQIGLHALDEKTRLEFETEQIESEYPKFSDLVKFVQNKCNILEISQEGISKPTQRKTLLMAENRNAHPTEKFSKKPSEKKPTPFVCSVCNSAGHRIASCPQFLKMDVTNRYNQVKSLKLCFSCFSSMHNRPECKSRYSCRTCKSNNHHSLLCDQNNHRGSTGEPAHPSTSSDNKYINSHLTSTQRPGNSTVLLGTAIVQVQDRYGTWHAMRCILDSGSQTSVITNCAAQQLKLSRRHTNIQVSGIDTETPIKAKGEMTLNVLPHPGMVKSTTKPLSIETIILPKIASKISSNLNHQVLDQYAHLTLADLTYVNPNLDQTIELLIGADYYCQILDNRNQTIVGSPSAVPSWLGWLLMGKCPDPDASSGQCTTVHNFFISEDNLSTQLQKFWEVEELPRPKPKNPEDELCEQHFIDTHTRAADGRYILRLPFKNLLPPDLGSNRDHALRRLASLDRKLERNPAYKTLYEENLQSYLEPGHMKVAGGQADYFLVHHGVYRESSSTTKLRVVFDPNIPGSSGNTLAKSLLIGPPLQKDISDLLIHFRCNPIALIADIQQMYRNIWIHPDDQKFQQILWHEKNSREVTQYALTTCTFGLPGSPYQAQRVLKQLALDEGKSCPKAAEVITNFCYVDDLVFGSSTVGSAIDLKNEVISLLSRGGFTVRKWASSQPKVLEGMSAELCEKPHSFSEGGEESLKVLGMRWSPKSDAFFFTLQPQSNLSTLTKREVLSFIAKIYDCNGYLSPTIVWMKIFLQALWLNKGIGWDTPLEGDLCEKWLNFTSQLHLLENIKIPRYMGIENASHLRLIGMADASKSAYAAVAYLRVRDQGGNVNTYLLRSKTKVCPIKSLMTINRAELQAALLLSKLIESLRFLNVKDIHLFSDSVTVLSWLRTPPHQLKTFVANRVSQILELTQPDQWSYVPSEQNSADPASRGIVPSLLVGNNLWFNGPSWVKLPIEDWPKSLVKLDQVPEMKSIHLTTESTTNPLLKVIEKIPSLNKLKRVFAYVLKFVHIVRMRIRKKCNPTPLSVAETDRALKVVIRITQQHYLSDEIKAVQKGQPVASLKSLSPIINGDGILAVGGRLANAPIPEESKHPILLPSKCHLTILLIDHYHLLSLHGGPRVVQSLIQRSYWIIGARSLIRHHLTKCVKCFRMKPSFPQPLMADLPKSRFAQGRAFLHTALDLAGPYNLKSGERRNSPIVKAYFVIFVCMSVKAIHLELVSSLSTECFLAALDRFIGRRSLPSLIRSDNGTNLRGSARHISETYQFLTASQDEISSYLLDHEIKWEFNPPSGPTFGGLFESGVRSVKKHLKHALGANIYNYEQFQSILIAAESCCNSRPLCALGINPNDGIDILTPGHFLTGGPLLARPERDISDTYIPPGKRWLLVVQANQTFWKRWQNSYINTLIQRNKWTKPMDNIKLDDIVLIQTPNCPSQHYPLGRVIKLMPGPDQVVRVVTVRTASGELVRPVSKLAVLPVGNPYD